MVLPKSLYRYTNSSSSYNKSSSQEVENNSSASIDLSSDDRFYKRKVEKYMKDSKRLKAEIRILRKELLSKIPQQV